MQKFRRSGVHPGSLLTRSDFSAHACHLREAQRGPNWDWNRIPVLWLPGLCSSLKRKRALSLRHFVAYPVH